MRLIDEDALIEDLEYDVELDARQLDDMDFVGKKRELVQFDKDCKQNAIDLLRHAPIIEPEQKKGTWMHDKDDGLYSGYCSCCGWVSVIMETDVAGMPFCPNCGADMREE